MPGPSNKRKIKRTRDKKSTQRLRRCGTDTSAGEAATFATPDDPPDRLLARDSAATSASAQPHTPDLLRYYTLHDNSETKHLDAPEPDDNLPKAPCIVDPGNGPRVKDMHGFLATSFASPHDLEDPLCKELAQPEVLEMICSVLPEEIGLILWYNKTRRTSRICPACQRLYNLGDVLQTHFDESDGQFDEDTSQLQLEQGISGLCSAICFILASYNYPGAIRSTWGRTADELDDTTWDLLNGPGIGFDDKGMSMMLKMSRLPELGLDQLCFPEGHVELQDEAV